MSYTILYRSMFLKMSDGRYIPQAETGDNNDYVTGWSGREKRSRSWENLFYLNGQPPKPAYTEDELLKNVQDMIKETILTYTEDRHGRGEKATEEDIRKHFGWYSSIAVRSSGTSGTTARMVESFTVMGIRRAITWDEFEQAGLRLKLMYWDKDNTFHYVEMKNEQEYLQKWDELTREGHHVYVGYSWMPDYLYSRHCRKLTKCKTESTKGYAVSFVYRGCTYMMPIGTRNRLLLYGKISAKTVFSSMEAAQKAMARLLRRFNHDSSITDQKVITVIREDINKPWNTAVPAGNYQG